MAGDGPAQNAGTLVSETADAVLKAGASVARTFAEAVSGRAQPIVSGEPPLASMVRHASAGVATVARIMVEAARSGATGAATANAPAPAAHTPSGPPAEPPSGPVVAPGATLRIPLSVDNPGDTEMAGLVPAVLGARLDGAPADPPKVRFQPRKLSIAPRDFEKLVLLIDIPAEAAEGRWTVSFSLGGATDTPSDISFRVARA